MTRPFLQQPPPGAEVAQLGRLMFDSAFPPAPVTPPTFVEWVDQQIANGLRVDGKPFTWKGFEPLKAVYEAIGSHSDVVLIKSAQMGATVMMLLSVLYRAETHPGCSLGYYFPTRGDVAELSKIRFRPLAEQVAGPSHQSMQGPDAKTVMVTSINGSPIYFRYTEGRVSKDSIPLDGITFDELRLMNDADVDQIMERVSGSAHHWLLACSTAGYPDCDIDRWFQKSTMHRFQTKCAHCEFSFCMALEWPNCVAVDHEGDDFRARYICTRCKKDIDPLKGEWVAEHPGRTRIGFHLHQMLAQHNTATRMWEAWVTTRNKAEFYKAKLGLPYIDATAIPLTIDYLRQNCVDPELRWMMAPNKKRDSFLGADQRGGEIHVVVLGIHPTRPDSWALRHVEVIQAEDPWERLAEIVKFYDVDTGIVDALPSKNESIRFAKRFTGRIFVSFYDTDPKTADVVRWGDRPKEGILVRKGSEDIKYKYTARIARYLAIGSALDYWLQGRMWTPEPEALHQTIVVNGRKEVMSPVDSSHAKLQGQTLFKHLCSVAREVEKDEDTGEIKKAIWINLGLDPHFLHAYEYAIVAAGRDGARPKFLDSAVPGGTLYEQIVVTPEVPKEALDTFVGAMAGRELRTAHKGRLCGGCSMMKKSKESDTTGLCVVNGFHVEDHSLPCDFWASRESE